MRRTFDDRLNPDSYRDDEPCQIRLEADPRDEKTDFVAGWISKKLLDRMRHLALAYDLPLLARLSGNGEVRYPEAQLSAHDPRGWSLVVERP